MSPVPLDNVKMVLVVMVVVLCAYKVIQVQNVYHVLLLIVCMGSVPLL